MAYRDSTTNGATSGTTSSVNVPAGVVAGDIVVLKLSRDSTTAFGTWPAGFTEAINVALSVVDTQRVGAAWKRLTAADTGTYTCGAAPGANDWVMQAIAFSGRHATDPPVFSSTTSDAANAIGAGLAITAPSVTTLAGDDLLYGCLPDTSVADGTVATAPPSGYTEAKDQESNFAYIETAYKENVVAGATGTVAGTLTASGGNAGWVAVHVRIPAAAVAADGARAPQSQPTLNPGGVPMAPSALAPGKSSGYSAARWQEWEKYPWATPPAVVVQIGQPYWLWNATERLYDELEPYSAPAYSLHRFRTAYQTVGQPWLLRSPLVTPRQEPEEYTVKPVNQALLYGRVSATIATGAPWYLWKPAARQLDIEEYGQPQPVSLHRYRTGFQTVGQPWFLLFKPRAPAVEVEEYAPPTVNYAIQFGRTTPIASPGQPWYLWKPWPLKWELMTYVEPYEIPVFNPFLIERNVVPIIPPVQLTGSEYIIRARRRSRR